MSAKTFVRDRFNDAALAGQRLDGWLQAQQDYTNLTEKIESWRQSGPVSKLDVPGDGHAETQRFFEAVQIKKALENIKNQADSGMITLVSDRFYRDEVFAAVNRMQKDSIDERAIGYKSFWNDMKSLLDKQIEHLNDYYEGKDGYRSPSSPIELASALRLLAVCRAILHGQTADQAFDSVYRVGSARAWFPASPHAYTLPADEAQAADLVENKYQQLVDNIVGLLLESAKFSGEKEANLPWAEDSQRFLKLWFVTLVKEYDEAASFIGRDMNWFDKSLAMIGEKIDITVEAARAEEQKHILPFHPTWNSKGSVNARLSRKPEAATPQIQP